MTKLTIYESEGNEIKDAKLREIADNIADMAILGAMKAIAHEADGALYPLPDDAGAFENIFSKYIRTLPIREKSVATKKVLDNIRANSYPNVSNRALTKVDFKKPISVEKQAPTIYPQIIKEISLPDLKRFIKIEIPNFIFEEGFVPHQSPSRVLMRLRNVTCVKETGLTSWGSDQMYLAAVTTDTHGSVNTLGPFDLGKYDTGDSRDFYNEVVPTFKLIGTGWPRTFAVTWVLSKEARSELWDLINELAQKLRKYIIEIAGAALGAYIGATVGGSLGSIIPGLGTAVGALVGAAVGAFIGYVFDKIWGFLKDWLTGHVFKPFTYRLNIHAHNSKFNNGTDVSNIKILSTKGAYGEYQTKYTWENQWEPANIVTAINHGFPYLFTVDDDSSIYFNTDSSVHFGRRRDGVGKYTFPDEWIDLNGGVFSPDSPISGVSRDFGKLDVFVIGFDGRVWAAALNRKTNNGEWRGWWSVLNAVSIIGTKVGVVSRHPDLLDIFMVGTDGNIYTAAWDQNRDNEGEWRGWWQIANGKALPGSLVSAASRGINNLDVFVAGTDGRVWTAAWAGAEWAGWWPVLNLEVLPASPVSAISRAPDWLDVYVTGKNGGIYSASWHPSFTDGWHGWWAILDPNGPFKVQPGSPIAVASSGPDHLELFVVGLDGGVWKLDWGPETWGDNFSEGNWSRIKDLTVKPGSTISVNTTKYGQELYVVGSDRRIWTADRYHNSRDKWYGWFPINTPW